MTDGSFGRLADAPATLLLAGIRVIDPSSGADDVRDLGILDGKIVEPDRVQGTANRVDGHGWIVAPGLVDLHTHLREPGGEAAETIETGGRAAAHGGFTAVCAMPNTEPPLDDEALLRRLAERAGGAACRVRFVAAASRGRAGVAAANYESLARAGAIAFSDDGAAVPDGLVADALRALTRLRTPLFEHAEDPEIAGTGVMRAGPAATRLGLTPWSPRAELKVVERDIAFAARSGAHVHLTHLSTRASVAAVRSAKAHGVPVTADVTPHHLAMTDEWVAGSRRFAWDSTAQTTTPPSAAFDAACRVNPPLGTADDAAALLEGLADGTIDAIATDHAPHPAERKLVPFREGAPGMVGLETALSVGLAAVEAGALRLMTLIAALSTRPAAIIGEVRRLSPGAVADLVAFDPDARWRVDRSTLASRSTNTPLMGMELPGVVRLTVADGRVTYRS